MVYPDPPFVPGQFKFLKLLFTWCERHGVAVLLDFHGLKGSQTGNPTSGNCGACGHSQCGTTRVAFLEEQETNLKVIDSLTSYFSKSPAYLGFAVANEVASAADSKKTMEFYQKAYNIIRKKSEDALVVFFATFNPSTYPFPNFENVAVDLHIYFGMGFGETSTYQHENLQHAAHAVSGLHWPVLVGEWSLGGCGHPDIKPGPAQLQHFFRRFAKMQLQAYETKTTGWFYWSYKTMYPNSTWNFRDMCEIGWVPGCVEGLTYGPAEWWDTPLCSYTYLDGGCGHREVQVQPQQTPPAWWIGPAVLAALVLLAGAAVAAVHVLQPGWVLRWLSAAHGTGLLAYRSAMTSLAATAARLQAGLPDGTVAKTTGRLPQLSGWQLVDAGIVEGGEQSRPADSVSSQVLIRHETAERPSQPFIW